MTRKLQPCGTRSAYKRHLYNHETPCDACKAANSAAVNETAMDKELKKHPPRILWRKTRGGVFVAVSIHDPHAERGNNRPVVYEPIEPEPVAPPERMDPSLLNAARTLT
jgi:hypothetical protein